MAKRSKTYVAIAPGATIKEQLVGREMMQKEFAVRMGMSEKHISKLINGEVRLTPSVARKLESVLGIPARFWMNLEAIYQENLALVEEENALEAECTLVKLFPYNEMSKHGWVPKTKKPVEKAANLRSFFEVASMSLVFNAYAPNVAYRRQSVSQKSEYALMAWSQQAKREARKISTEAIDVNRLKLSIPRIREMTRKDPDEFCPVLVSMMSSCGIALVFLPHFQGSFLHGATFKDGKRFVLGLTVRGCYADKFWFSLFHEIGHIVEGHVGKEGGTTEADEAAADAFAREALISPDSYARLLSRGKPLKQDVREFADSIGIAPGIVVGRLQNEHVIGFDQMNDLKEKYAIVD